MLRLSVAKLASWKQREQRLYVPHASLLRPFLKPDDTHWGWSVSALASSGQDMHDVSEIECHARGSGMERRIKEGERWQMKRDQQKGAVHKSGMEGNRWIEGVRQKERQGWKGGIKRAEDKRAKKDRNRLFLNCGGTGAARFPNSQRFIGAHKQTHTHGNMLLWSPAGCLQRHESQCPYGYTTTHANILCCLTTSITGNLTFSWHKKGEDLRFLSGRVKGVRGAAALHRSGWYSTRKQSAPAPQQR